LAAGWLGMTQDLTPSEPVATDASALGIELPRNLLEALVHFEQCAPLREVLGEVFCSSYATVKRAEYETFMQTISPWEREFLLLNV
jgi:glutamine synthetase